MAPPDATKNVEEAGGAPNYNALAPPVNPSYNALAQPANPNYNALAPPASPNYNAQVAPANYNAPNPNYNAMAQPSSLAAAAAAAAGPADRCAVWVGLDAVVGWCKFNPVETC